jgi:hypothetical protein
MHSSNIYYILKEGALRESNREEWEAWSDKPRNRRVAVHIIRGIVIYTYCIGIDRSLIGTDAPLLFETMVYGGALDGQVCHYATLEAARKGHHQWCAAVINHL